jgi:hypothetical protein
MVGALEDGLALKIARPLGGSVPHLHRDSELGGVDIPLLDKVDLAVGDANREVGSGLLGAVAVGDGAGVKPYVAGGGRVAVGRLAGLLAGGASAGRGDREKSGAQKRSDPAREAPKAPRGAAGS